MNMFKEWFHHEQPETPPQSKPEATPNGDKDSFELLRDKNDAADEAEKQREEERKHRRYSN